LRQLTTLTESSRQRYDVTTEDGVAFVLSLAYNPRTSAWVCSFTYGSTIIDGITLVASPNLLRQWRNVIPFGLACVVNDNLDPLYINDFTTQRVILYVLSASETTLIESEVFA